MSSHLFCWNWKTKIARIYCPEQFDLVKKKKEKTNEKQLKTSLETFDT